MKRPASRALAVAAAIALALPALTIPLPIATSIPVAQIATTELTGTETIAGKITGTTGTPGSFNVSARGIFSDRGAVTIELSDQGGLLTFRLSRGSIRVTYQVLNQVTVTDLANCHITDHLSTSYRLAGGTGDYTRISGHGLLAVSFGSRYPVVKGACMGVLKPVQGSSVATVSLQGPTTRRTAVVTLPAGTTILP